MENLDFIIERINQTLSDFKRNLELILLFIIEVVAEKLYVIFINVFRNTPKAPKNFSLTGVLAADPIAVVLAAGNNASPSELTAARELTAEIAEYVRQGFNSSQITAYVTNQLELELSSTSLSYAVNYALKQKLINISDETV
jgi:hypothetical protein